MSNAPTKGTILHVRGRTIDGTILEPIHYAHGGGDDQPEFRGWFRPDNYHNPSAPLHGYHQVFPVEWQPLRAKP